MGGEVESATASRTNSAWAHNEVYARIERVLVWVIPSLGDAVFVCVLLAVVFGLQGSALGTDGDSAWTIRIGQQILAHGLPHHEFLLSTTMHRPVVYWEWLSQIIYASAYRLGGLNGVVATAGLVVSLCGVGLYLAARNRGVPLLLALALALTGLALTSITWTARAQLFSLPLTLWWSEEIWRFRRSRQKRRLWLFPAITVLWANLHGGFIAGLILLAIAAGVEWLAPEQRDFGSARALTLALGASALATLCTPWGIGLPRYILRYLTDPLVTRYTQEYQSPDFHTFLGVSFLALIGLLLAAWLVLVRMRARLDPLFVVIATVWTLMALFSVRFVPLWGLIVLPTLGAQLAAACSGLTNVIPRDSPLPLARVGARVQRVFGWAGDASRRVELTDRRVGKGIWSLLAALFVAALVLRGGMLPFAQSPALHATYDSTALPVEAAQRLAAGGLPAGRGFNTFEWGGYLELALPRYHPFIDSRSDAYGNTLFADYATIISMKPGWQTLLARYNVRWALLPTMMPLTTVLTQTPGWRCMPADSHHVATLCERAVP